MVYSLLRIIAIAFAIIFLNGCSIIYGFKENLDQYEQQLINDDCDYTKVTGQIKSDPLLWTLNTGALARQCGDLEKSNEYFDKAEAIFKQQELALEVASIGKSIASITINNNVNDYHGNNHEKIMVNLYKGLNFMALDDYTNARVEFNRTLDRQRRATEYFEKEISAAYDSFYQSEYMHEIVKPINSSTKIDNSNYIGDITPDSIYPNFVNPFATYMSALFFYFDEDYSKARSLLKQTANMLPHQKQVKADLALADKGAKNKEKYVWLIYENGLGVIKKSFSYRFPTYLFSNNVVTTDINLPTIYKRDSSYPYLMLGSAKTTEIANMDNIIQLEFSKQLPAIITEAMLNTVFKSSVQYSLEQNFQEFGGKWLGFLYQLATDTADVRQWRAMPKNFQIARIKLTDKPIIIYRPDGSILKQIDSLSLDQNAIIYIKSDIVNHYTMQIIQRNTH
ncbi:hypothetical protein RCS94_00540 [Orbaceae bacterium ac157xtp]